MRGGKRGQDKSIILVTGRQSMSLIIKTSELYKCIFELSEAFFFLKINGSLNLAVVRK